ncbi:MAG: hypothetical protein MJ172_06400 [Clostridia bacterium]|nr:hypothetical protein [Clostridia bacterium]
MAVYYYGVDNYRKNIGPHGEAYECPACHKTYQDTYIRVNKWGHIDHIPLLYLGRYYVHICPICGAGDKFAKNKIAKENMKAETAPSTQNLVYRSVFHKSAKPKTYDLFVDDKNTGETFTIRTAIPKGDYKYEIKGFGLKKLKPETID